MADVYLKWHQAVWAQPDLSAADSRDKAKQLTSLPPANPSGSFLVLSPRQTTEAVTECAARVTKPGNKLVCFTAPFAMHDDLEAALAASPAQVFGLLNNDNVVGEALHKAPNTQLAFAAALDKQTAIEIWQQQGRAESLHHSGVFIYTKLILVNPLSDSPLVITGSANFSDNSSMKNDENQLFIFGEKEVADIYLGEFMRMFDHYYFRSYLKRIAKERAKAAKETQPAGKPAAKKPGHLAGDDSWTAAFFANGPKQKLREAFY